MLIVVDNSKIVLTIVLFNDASYTFDVYDNRDDVFNSDVEHIVYIVFHHILIGCRVNKRIHDMMKYAYIMIHVSCILCVMKYFLVGNIMLYTHKLHI